MNEKTYKEAVKIVKADKVRENYMVFEWSYSDKLVMPYKAGLQLMGALEQAEKLSDSYGSVKNITEYERDSFKFTVMPAKEYDRIKMGALLNLTQQELIDFERAAALATSATLTGETQSSPAAA